MPNYDQTGPLGQGTMTGRRMGRCTNYGNQLNENFIENQGISENQQSNQPFGRGLRRNRMNQNNFVCGCGFGRRNKWQRGFRRNGTQ